MIEDYMITTDEKRHASHCEHTPPNEYMLNDPMRPIGNFVNII